MPSVSSLDDPSNPHPSRIWLPEDWDFRSCPKAELPVCWHYEFARESNRLILLVEIIRRVGPKRPHFYVRKDFVNFGWSEWWRQPYLTIPLQERENRLKWLQEPSDEALAGLLNPNWSYLPGDAPRVEIQLPQDKTGKELKRSFDALLRLQRRNSSRNRKATGRAATKAMYNDWLRALGVYRLRQPHTSGAVLKMFQASYGTECPYRDETAIEHALAKAKDYVTRFCESAERLAQIDVWFVPFTYFFIEI
jgi:hypothetical protein